MNKDLNNIQGKEKRKFQRTGQDVKLAFPEGNESKNGCRFF